MIQIFYLFQISDPILIASLVEYLVYLGVKTIPVKSVRKNTKIKYVNNLTKLNISNTTHHFKDEYNDYMGGFNDSILNFLYYHYLIYG